MAEKHGGRKKGGGGIFGLFRLLLSLIIFSILAIGLYQAYRSFSGVDPLKMGSSQGLKNLIFSDKVYDLVTGLLKVDPQTSLQKIKNIAKGDPNTPQTGPSTGSQIPFLSASPTPAAPLQYRFAVVGDSHNDNANLERALARAKSVQASFVIGLGDYTDVGTVADLQKAKNIFEASGLNYYSTAGDHDLWDSRDKGSQAINNYYQVFGSAYTSFTHQDSRFLIIYNSDNYLGIDGIEQKWIDDQLSQIKADPPKQLFVFVGIPLYHPSSDHVVGKVEPKLKEQATKLINDLKQANVTAVFAGDAHYFSQYKEPTTNLEMTVVGALTSTRNLQSPRFVLVDVYTDGSYNIQDTPLE